MLATLLAARVVVLAGLALLLLTFASPAQDGRLLARHQTAGQTCVACHSEQPPSAKPRPAVCQTCHGDQGKLAATTVKADPNPHAPPHLAAGEAQLCGDCHSIHKQSEVTCIDCHRGFQFNVK
jgi:nitrate/TMAO reductase-like tetraheme cytochrome c subunit